MSDPVSITEKLCAPFPLDLVEQRDGRSYINHAHIRLRIIEATDNRFSWEVVSVEYRSDGVVQRTNKDTKQREPALVKIVTGALTIPDLGTRFGEGVQVMEQNMGEDGYKMAESDAFKRAAMAFGVGLRQLYVDDGKLPEKKSSINLMDFASAVQDAVRENDAATLQKLIDTAYDQEDKQAVAVLIRYAPTKEMAIAIGKRADALGIDKGPAREAFLKRED